MQRRKLLQGMLTLPIASALGCRHKNQPQPPTAGKSGTLKIYLHGPFAVVMNSKNQYRVRAFVPFDEDGKHEFRYPTPKDLVSGEGDTGNRNHYEFALREDNLEISGKRPRVDAGFGPFQIHTGEWQPTPDQYFVSVDLPAPEVVTFVPQGVVPVQLATNRLAMMPLDHILEYKVRDSRKMEEIKLVSKKLRTERSPFTCQYLLSMHEEAMRAGSAKGNTSQLESDLRQCAEADMGAFFFGVGLPYNAFPPSAEKQHALKFFNHKILGSFPNSPQAKGLELKDVDIAPCATSGGATSYPTLSPAVQRYSLPEPHFQQVASFEECRAAGVIGTSP
jgi:hypothetical protein